MYNAFHYAGSDIVNDELVISGPATVNVSASATTNNTVQIRLVKTGGTVLATSTSAMNPSVSANGVTLAENETVWLEVYKSTTLSRTVSGGSVTVVAA